MKVVAVGFVIDDVTSFISVTGAGATATPDSTFWMLATGVRLQFPVPALAVFQLHNVPLLFADVTR